MTSPLLTLSGAYPADGLDAGVALHYGDPIGEQRSLANEVGWVDRSHRPVVSVSGVDRLTWLHSITSAHLSQLSDGSAAEALVLSPHGHIEHHLLLSELAGTTWLDLEPGTAPDLLAYLESMRFMMQVSSDDVSADWAVLSLVGPQVTDLLGKLGVGEPDNPYRVASLAAAGWARTMPWPGQHAADLVVPRSLLSEAASRLTELGARPAGIWAYEAMRVEARRPRLRYETDHRTIPHEVGWIGVAVHLEKGCYRGQETVARVQNLGRPPRRMVLLHLDGSVDQLPVHGDPITMNGRQIGFVGTAVRHWQLGPIALGLVKRNTQDDARLLAGDIAAAIDN